MKLNILYRSRMIIEAKGFPSDYLVSISREEEGDGIWISVYHRDMEAWVRENVNARWGTEYTKYTGYEPAKLGEGELAEVRHGYRTFHPEVLRGYGPIFYDIAIEIATLLGAGLISAQAARKYGYHMETTPAAQKIWEIYYTSRDDVTKSPIRGLEEIGPLQCVLTKPPTLLKRLASDGRLRNRLGDAFSI